jgi:hypothetical protein
MPKITTLIALTSCAVLAACSSDPGFQPEVDEFDIDPEDQTEIDAAVGADGIEWQVDMSSYIGEGFEGVELIMVEPIDCVDSNCGTTDSIDCGYFDMP